jgi:hypothetical protein
MGGHLNICMAEVGILRGALATEMVEVAAVVEAAADVPSHMKEHHTEELRQGPCWPCFYPGAFHMDERKYTGSKFYNRRSARSRLDSGQQGTDDIGNCNGIACPH